MTISELIESLEMTKRDVGDREIVTVADPYEEALVEYVPADVRVMTDEDENVSIVVFQEGQSPEYL